MLGKPPSRSDGRKDASTPKLPPLSATPLSSQSQATVPFTQKPQIHGITGLASEGRVASEATLLSEDATFLTGVKTRDSLYAIGDPSGMDRVRQLHGQLTSVVSTLNDKVSAVLKKQESEFLRAYRAHMYSVQKELAQLRAKADDAALQLAKNEKIRQLEAERDWYRSEALRLDSFCSSLKGDVEYIRDKLAAVEEDRAWLERQLKTSKRTAALQRGEERGGDAGEEGEEGEEGTGDHGGDFDGRTSSQSHTIQSGKHTSSSTGGINATTLSGWGPKLSKKPLSTAGLATVALRANGGSSSSFIENKHGTGSSHTLHVQMGTGSGAGASNTSTGAQGGLVKQLQTQLSAANKLVESMKTRNSRLKAANTALRSSRGELETFFLQCVEDVRKEVARRRVRAVASTNAATATALSGMLGPSSPGGRADGVSSPLPSPGMAEAAFNSNNSVDLAVALARARNATLADFTAADRRAVISRLLQDEFVLQSLHDVIFSDAHVSAQDQLNDMEEQLALTTV